MRCDAVIFGGGIAGLWLLDELRRGGYSVVLLENRALGSGQTVASQGIIHGGLKYTLSGMLTKSAANISEMPLVWRECFAGQSEPDLSDTTIRSNYCYLWRTQSFTSRLGMIGAKVGLRVAPENIAANDVPPVLKGCPGTVAKLEEQVMSPPSLISNLYERNRDVILKYNAQTGCEFQTGKPGQIEQITLSTEKGESLKLVPSRVILTAGKGNATLREQVGLSASAMQLRPLHMVMVRGNLPEFNGHCIDGSKTRVTITSDRDIRGQILWQIGGQVSEVGVEMTADELIAHTQQELAEVLPALDQDRLEWGTYRVDRAEQKTGGGKRPESFAIKSEGNTLTVWPTKLVLAPVVAAAILPKMTFDATWSNKEQQSLAAWGKPPVALPPWEVPGNWHQLPLRKSA
ncbi:MAG: FAD-dependent oxidoreductase [Planctomycetaceae bacterium]|jgi:glycerol-3-phosphate dehydrogenase|nr:FAD-dependent oxidoreductase [Planctomycetaceae bacterium]MDG2391616.1 FAD-dependent oxidoreductase [Planctomycetaceae bacterium]